MQLPLNFGYYQIPIEKHCQNCQKPNIYCQKIIFLNLKKNFFWNYNTQCLVLLFISSFNIVQKLVLITCHNEKRSKGCYFYQGVLLFTTKVTFFRCYHYVINHDICNNSWWYASSIWCYTANRLARNYDLRQTSNVLC